MSRSMTVAFTLVLAVALTGCGSGGGGGGGGTGGGGGAGGAGGAGGTDAAVAMPDLAVPPPTGMPTGSACKVNTDCMPPVGKAKGGQCLTNDQTTMTTFPNGYCTSPCNPANTDMTTGLNPDCPSPQATCELTGATTGRCVVKCEVATTDCRTADGYVCINNTPYAASCTPKGTTWCDPTMPTTSCKPAMDGNAQVCTDFSPDKSAGLCTETCDVFAQNCPMQTNQQLGCLYDTNNKVATCLFNSGVTQGMACRFLNDCAPGLACHSKTGANMPQCQPYCRAGSGVDAGTVVPDGGVEDVPCPSGLVCVDIQTGMTGAHIPLGICQPM